jgi:hypothetical protein
VKEVSTVFKHYGITVDLRHLFLIADYITMQGVINPISRGGMQYNTSPTLKMSFETTMKFLTDACLNNNFDNLNTPSGKMVLGRVPYVYVDSSERHRSLRLEVRLHLRGQRGIEISYFTTIT